MIVRTAPQLDFGVSREAFRDRHFEQRPLHRPGAFEAAGLGWGVIDEALDLQDVSRERFKVLHGGRLAPEDYVEEFIDIGVRRQRVVKHILYRHLQQGATLVLNRMELVSPLVRRLCLDVGHFTGIQTTANTYASFGPEPATNVHWDTHDVFVLQLKGQKHWQLFEPTHPLPISSQISNERKDEVPDEPVLDVVLRAGDALYVPRGWWHKVAPVPGHDTIHVTVAMHTPLVLDYVIWAAAHVLPDHLPFRRSMMGELSDADHVDGALTTLTEVLARPEIQAAFVARTRERERVVSPFGIDALLTNDPSPERSTIVLNSRTGSNPDGTIVVNGATCRFGGVHAQVIELLKPTGSTTVDALIAALPSLPKADVTQAVREMALADVIHLAH